MVAVMLVGVGILAFITLAMLLIMNRRVKPIAGSQTSAKSAAGPAAQAAGRTSGADD